MHWRKEQIMKFDSNLLLLYAVTDRRWLKEKPLSYAVEEAIQGGVTFVQLREKKISDELFLKEAEEIKNVCHKYNVPLIINDKVDVAIQVDADGVHVGQSDMEAGCVREKLGKDKIIGVSVQTVEQALRAQEQGADYLGVGAVFPTGSKEDAKDVDYETLCAICNAVTIPVVAIGGIGQENVAQLAGSGIAGVAVISAIFAQKDIKKSTVLLRESVENMVKS